jgi:hypothetical protein
MLNSGLTITTVYSLARLPRKGAALATATLKPRAKRGQVSFWI